MDDALIDDLIAAIRPYRGLAGMPRETVQLCIEKAREEYEEPTIAQIMSIMSSEYR